MATLDYGYISHLVTRAQCGDTNAFAEIYAATYQREFLISYHYLKSKQDAEDAIQETYILALKNLEQLKDPKLLIAWLNQINFRVCYSIAQKNRRMVSADAGIGDESDTSHDENPGPEEQMISIDSKKYIMQQIMKLPYTESQVILLRYFQDLSIEDITKVMDMSRSTVMRYLKSGKTRLGKLISRD